MRAPRWLGVALAACALVPAGVLGAIAARLFAGGRTSTAGLVEISVATLAAAGVSGHQLVAAFRKRLVVDEFGLARVGVFTRRRVSWHEVARVAYNPVNRWFFLTAADGSHVWVSIDTHGIGDFAEIALARLPAAALEKDALAREALEELAHGEAST